MSRSLSISFISALVGGAVVAAVVALAGGFKSQSRTVIQDAPVATASTPANSSQSKETGLTAHEIYERTAPGVVFVTSTTVEKSSSPFSLGGESEEQGEDTGSGIEINGSGDILTNWHVVENAVKITVGLDDSKTVEAKVIGKDPSDDLAVLKIPTEGVTLHPLTLGDSALVQVGEPVLAIGNPFDLERTLTTGVISALQRELTAPNGFKIDNVLQTDAPINPGNSGGPLLNAAGEVIGINSQIETAGDGDDGSVGIGFAVPINTAKKDLPDLLKGETIRGAYLGVSTVTIDGSLAPLNLPVKSGALVEEVQSGTAAAKAGIRGGDLVTTVNGLEVKIGGDIIIAVNGKKVTSAPDLAADIEAEQSGDKISIELLRASSGSYKHETVSVTLGSRPNTAPTTSSGSSSESETLTPESVEP